MNPLRSAVQGVRRHSRISSAALVVVLAAGGAGGYIAASGDSSPAAAAQATTTTQTVSTGTIRQSVSATGTLAPANDQTLNFSSAGVVTSVLVTEGQTVTKGQKLATIDSASLAATVAQAKATVATAKAKVEADESASADSSTTDAQLAADKAALTADRNQLASARTALAGATLTAPFSGTVASVGLTVGQSVSGSGSSSGSGSGSSGSSGGGLGGANSSSSSSSSSTGIQVISTGAWVVNATVDATSVDLLKAGQQAQLTVSGATDTVYGTISSVAVLSSSTSGTASYPVVVAVTGSPKGLHDGASVTATLIYKQLSNVIVIPSLALQRNTDGTSYVNKVVNGKTVKTPVTTGITSGAEVQITKGLAEGDQIQVIELARTDTGRAGTGGTNRTGTGGTGNFPAGRFPGGGNFPAGSFPAGGFPVGGLGEQNGG